MNVYCKINLLVWLMKNSLGSPTVSIYTLERPRAGMLLSLGGQMAQQLNLALKAWRVSGQPLGFYLMLVEGGSTRVDALPSKE